MKHRCTHACNGLNKKPKKREGRCIKVGIITTTLLTPLSATTRARANYILCRVIVHRGGRERGRESSRNGRRKTSVKRPTHSTPKLPPASRACIINDQNKPLTFTPDPLDAGSDHHAGVNGDGRGIGKRKKIPPRQNSLHKYRPEPRFWAFWGRH